MSIQHDLILWGKSRAIGEAPNGYPSQAAFAKEMGQGNVSMPGLDEDAHIRIDRVVSGLKVRKPDHYEVIRHAYHDSLKDHQIAERMNKSRSWVRGIRESAEYWLDGALNAIDCPEDFVAGV